MKVLKRMQLRNRYFQILVLCFLLISSTTWCLFTETSEAAGNQIYVKNTYAYDNGDGTANRPYRSIQKAIDLASDGDSIYVFEGIYNESLTINKRVNISGLDRTNTKIQKSGGSYRYLIDISADNVALEDFNITDVPGSIRTALIHVTADNVRIVGVRVTQGKKWGIYLDGSSDGIIGFSTIDNMSDSGIFGENSDNNVFSDNNFFQNSVTALYISSSNNNIIFNNTFKKTDVITLTGNAIDGENCNRSNISNNLILNCSLDGVHLYGGEFNLVQKNTIKYCDRQSIFMSSSDSIIFQNFLVDNSIGIYLKGSNCQLTSNIIQNSVGVGLLADTETRNNIISLNQFILNEENAKDIGSNQWFSQGLGNYWDDYDDGDRDLNGIGDSPYTRMGGIDYYPTGKFLRPPQKPTDPSPIDGKDEVGLSITLRVVVSDPDSQTLSVYFYNALNNQTLGYHAGIQSGKSAYCSFTLPFETTLSWYTIVSDGKLENRSDIWFFTTRQIPPTNEKPIANPGGPYSVKLGQSVIFDGSQSRDPDGQIIFYRWNFGDGSSEILDQAPRHTYADPGSYTVTLTVVDNSGRSAIANSTITVIGEVYANAQPIAVFNAPSSVFVNQLTNFDASASNDTDGTIVGYRWDFNGDGTFDTDWLNASVATNAFSSVGSSIVTLEVKDDGNATGSFSTTIAVKAVEKKTPGFDIILVFLAILVGLLIYNKQKK
jgi:parallel beta-helix repeat protein